MSQYPSKPAELAASLRVLAERLDTIGDVDLAPTAVAMSISIQLHQHYGTQVERIAAVDAFASALDMPTSPSGGLYGTEHDHEGRLGVFSVSVYTGIRSERELALEQENEELRAKLSAGGQA